MKPLIVGNWKCNPSSLKEAVKIFNRIKKETNLLKKAEVIICVPFIYLWPLKNISKNKINLGVQDIFFEEKGPFTGQISPLMVKDSGCKYAIIGHSEKRKLGDDDDTINKKIKKSISCGLRVILCVGEDQDARKTKNMFEVIFDQLKNGLAGVSKKHVKNITIAYEPVWSIGTGKFCPVDDVMVMNIFIKKTIIKLFGKNSAQKIRIIYGGSVNSENGSDYIKKALMQGLLIGAESLTGGFSQIIKKI